MAQKLDSLRSSHPIQVPIKHAEEVEQVFDHISYAKGSVVIRMADHVLGKEKFREGLQLYFTRHKYSNTETTDLWNAWSDVSGINMTELMNSWTSKMGYPYLKVISESWSDNECCVELEQAWFLVDGTGDSESKLWNIPLSITSSAEVSTGNSIQSKQISDIASEKSFRRVIKFDTDSRGWIKINSGQAALVRVSHSEEMLSRILVPGIVDKRLSPIDRAALLDDQYYLAVSGLAPLKSVLMLLSAYEFEDSSTVWKSLHPIVLGLHQAFNAVKSIRPGNTDAISAHDAFVSLIKQKLILPALQRVGWFSRPGELDVDKLMRQSIFALMEEFCFSDSEIAAQTKKMFEDSIAVSLVNPDDDTLSADIKVIIVDSSINIYYVMCAYSCAK
jgi:puromycin-sensitive aminopeptidase